jgi:hypothetical protein
MARISRLDRSEVTPEMAALYGGASRTGHRPRLIPIKFQGSAYFRCNSNGGNRNPVPRRTFLA